MAGPGWVRLAAWGSALDPDNPGAPGQTLAQPLRQLHLDRDVGGAVDHQRRAADLAEPVGDVVAFEQRVAGLAHGLAREPAPLLDPHGVQLRFADDQVRDRVGQLVHGPVREPGLLHLAVGGQPLRVLDPGLGVDQDQRAHAQGSGEGHAHREEPALGHPADDRTLDAEVVEQPEAIGGRVPVGERLAVELGLAEPTLVPRDHTELRGQGLDLGGEHLTVHEEAVGEDHRRSVAAAVLVSDALPVDLCVRHAPSSGRKAASLTDGRIQVVEQLDQPLPAVGPLFAVASTSRVQGLEQRQPPHRGGRHLQQPLEPRALGELAEQPS